ncbi:hypothetical protein N015_17820 [Pseudomonas asturiensis]|uniref:Uncharacterized protein n=1 Tax=Pseudomonas asturiensis TaxID=1190415 RepID=A0ABX6HEZ4_9PSED|nr:hypothetical protein [Pseudomonas asturiensis]QHF04164.1 hypothetical protein N015_17820 [Pseudomonas asturiensis]
MNIKKIELAAPTIPAADHDGLIKTEDLQSAIEVRFTINGLIREGDRAELIINDVATGIEETITDPNPPGEVSFSMSMQPEHFISDGVYTINYRWVGYPGSVANDSRATTIRIDRTAPGATLLAPIIFPQINFGDVLKGAIPGYADMQPGDRIQTICNGIDGPAHVVTPEDLSDRPVQIAFQRDFLTHLDSEHITFSYQITDRAGNVSIMAQLVELSMQR